MPVLDAASKEKLTRFALALVDQQRARVIVPPARSAPGFWFGGGNLIEDSGGVLYVVGRYRNVGDSRTGLAAGERGWELAIFTSENRGRSFEKVLRFGKRDLDVKGHEVLSIEGSALRLTDEGVELFVSTEKDNVGYPAGFEEHLKPGTGVWSIERLTASAMAGLADVTPTTIVASDDPRFVHIKDPFVYETPDRDMALLFCTHPYCWTSSNTGYTIRRQGSDRFEPPVFDFFPRGVTWDVAMTRGTCVVDVPRIGTFGDRRTSLVFYDGGECVRNLDEHRAAASRPRGYSCEELGGAAFIADGNFSAINRLSVHRPLFVSPHGSGCSRYVDVLETQDGFYATWQQSQPDGSQPLVLNILAHDEVQRLLA